jgi:hypothetical protein
MDSFLYAITISYGRGIIYKAVSGPEIFFFAKTHLLKQIHLSASKQLCIIVKLSIDNGLKASICLAN